VSENEIALINRFGFCTQKTSDGFDSESLSSCDFCLTFLFVFRYFLLCSANVQQPLCIAAVREHIRKNATRLSAKMKQRQAEADAAAAAARKAINSSSSSSSSSSASSAIDARLSLIDMRAGERVGAQLCDWPTLTSDFPDTVGAFQSRGAIVPALSALRHTVGALWTQQERKQKQQQQQQQQAAADVQTTASQQSPLVGYLAVKVMEAKKEGTSAFSFHQLLFYLMKLF
jgi:hypothetical protein